MPPPRRRRPAVLVTLALGAVMTAACTGSDLTTPEALVGPSSSSSGSGPSGSESRAEVEIRGAIATLTGTCPAIAFTLGSTRIATESATEFNGVPCAALRIGQRVKVHGTPQADGSILAREVEPEMETPAPPGPGGAPIEVEGLIQTLAGTCPTVSFALGGTAVRTSAATQFERIPCARLENGMDVEVTGRAESDGSVAAVEVEPEEQEVESTIGALQGACPERVISLGNGPTAVALPTTRFDDTSCADLAVGMRVELRGVRRSNGTLFATRIRPGGNDDPDDDDDDDKDEDENENAEVSGRVDSLAGACPDRSFTVGGRSVRTHAATRFDDVGCVSLRNGMSVEVKGTRQPNGSLLASRVKRKE